MRSKKYAYLFIGAGTLLLLTLGMLFLQPARRVSAQCGSQASSCKNCHETQAKDPVNNDGTAWHSQHSFGDFCYLCHAGNNQATDKTAAHQGMVAPLSDINASCKSCHTNDTLAKAQVYATALNVQVGTNSANGVASSATQPPVQAATAAPAAAVPQAHVVLTADTVDYTQRYDEVALGKKPANVGNIILMGLLALLVLGGGFFVLQREGFIKISFEDPKKMAVEKKYPADVAELLPGLTKLKPEARKTLNKLLSKPDVAADLFGSIDRLIQPEAEDGEETETEEKTDDSAE